MESKLTKKIILAILFLIGAGALVYFSFLYQGSESSENKKPIKEVNLELKWSHQAQFAGNYVAEKKGYYAKDGFKVNFIPFVSESRTIDEVVSGRSAFGIIGADGLVLARERGIPIKAIAVIYKINPICAYTLKKSGIVRPQDFVGKTVGIQMGSNVEYLYAVMMNKLKIDRSKINEVPVGFTAKELLDGTVDVSTGYFTDQPHQAIEAGEEVNVILMSDYGAGMYADVLFTTEETVKNKPDFVEGFLRATLNGWQYALENTKEAVDITLEYATSSTRNHEQYVLSSSGPLIGTGDSPLGWMDASGWANVQNILFEQKILGKRINISEAYDMQFLNKIYNKN